MKVKPPASNIEWKAWAKRDPLYAVATCPETDRNGDKPWTDEGFYALGHSDWQDFHSAWERYGISHESCVEIGCGAGRMTRQLARDFKRVHAVDISEDMLAYACKHVTAPNVRFQICAGADLPIDDASVTSAFSCHVFQHFDDLDVARTYFLEIHRVLAEGGSLMVHVPVFCWPMTFQKCETIRRAHKRWIDFKASVNRHLINRGFFRPLMRRLEFPLEWFFAELPKLGFEDVALHVVATRSGDAPHPFVLARKSVFTRASTAAVATAEPAGPWN